MKNIHVLKTDKPSRVHKDSEFFISPKYQISKQINSIVEGKNIYITSDEEIKEGDWVMEFQKGDNIGEVHFINSQYVIARNIQKKIILTTDQDLIKDGVQALDDEFLEWFVNNSSCEEVEVQKGFADGTNWGYNFLDYKIIIPNN